MTQGYEQRALLATKTKMSGTRDYFKPVISFRAPMATYKSILSYCIAQEGSELIVIVFVQHLFAASKEKRLPRKIS